MAKQPKVSHTLFMHEFLRRPEVARNNCLLDIILNIAQKTRYAPALHELLALQKKRTEEAKSAAEKLPLGEDGKWLTLQEIDALQLGHERPMLTNLLEKHKAYFQSSQNTTPDATGDTLRYWISYENVSLLDRGNAHASQWKLRAYSAKYEMASLGRLLLIAKNLEARCQEEDAVLPTSHITASRNIKKCKAPEVEPLPDGSCWVSYYAITKAGSQYSLNSLRQKTVTHSEAKRIQKKGATFQRRLLITQNNYYLVGLEAFPESWLHPDAPRPPSIPKNPSQNTTEGIFMPIREVISKTTLLPSRVYYIISKHQLRKERKRGEGVQKRVYVTPENWRILGLPCYPGEIVPDIEERKAVHPSSEYTGPREIELTLGNNKSSFSANTNYLPRIVGKILQQIHGGFFDEAALTNALRHLTDTGYIPGKRLVPFLEQVNGMILLTSHSGQKRLEEELGLPFRTIETNLANNGQQYMHELPSVALGKRYVLERDLPALRTLLAQHK